MHMITDYGPKTPDGINSTGVVSVENSSTTPLGIAGVFTGDWEDVSGYSSVECAVLTDEEGTLEIQFSPDGINSDSSHTYNVDSNTNEVHRLTVTRKYYRIVMTNGAVAQTFMRLQSLKGVHGVFTSGLNSAIQPDSDATISRSINEEMLIAEGKYSDRLIVHQFGRNPDIDTGSVPEDVWDGGGVYTGFPLTAAETLSVVSSDIRDVVAGPGAKAITVYGLDANFNLQEETILLNGTAPVTSTNTFSRVYKAIVLAAGTDQTNDGDITINHSSTTANVFSVMQNGRGHSEVSAFTIPSGYSGYLKRYVTSSVNTTMSTGLWMRPVNGAVQIMEPAYGVTFNFDSTSPYGGIKFLEKTDMIFRVFSSTQNNSEAVSSYEILLVKN